MSAKARLLVVDDDQGVVDYLCEMLQLEGYEAVGDASPLSALARVGKEPFDLVVADIEMPQLRGIDLLAKIQAARPQQLVLLITAFGSIDLAVQAVKAGACDFLAKPFKIEVLYLAVERALREREMRREITRLRVARPRSGPPSLVARSAGMKRAVELATRAAETATTVLLTGETGTGKGVLAQMIHDSSARKASPFVQLNCAAIPVALLESELFGARQGAFTDARVDRPGMLMAARGGTLFLDEIGELSLEVQAKLLHVLESRRVRALGGTEEEEFDARLVAATNRPLEALLRDGRFRPDLYYRLNVIRIDIPPLRERRDDILPLIDHFLQQAGDRLDRQIIGVSSAALRQLLSYDWPGNVRELANELERAVALAKKDTLLPEDFDLSGSKPTLKNLLDESLARDLPLEEVERAYVRRVVDAQGGNKAAAARILGINRRTLYRKIGE
ncbi:MAG TPA: sigma-54 dependent transcriptional regulator [Myxococcales bacterium]|jgi:DNA-binding NtrC family response regulator